MRMSNDFRTRTASVIELLAKAALEEIRKVVDLLDSVVLGFELSQDQNEGVQRKPLFMVSSK